MAKASDNLFPYVHLVPASAPASPAAGAERIYLDSGDGNKLKRKNSSGAVTLVEGGGGGSAGAGTILAVKEATAAAAYSIASTTNADVDATNLAITFTAPSSGNVFVDLECTGESNVSTGFEWTLRNGTTVVKTVTMGNAPAYGRYRARIYVSGLTPGASLTYKWGAHRAGTGTHTIYTGGSGGVSGNATMTVVQAP